MIIGLTGGIGSGKTAVSDIFQDLGITIVDADLASRVVVDKGREELNKISTSLKVGLEKTINWYSNLIQYNKIS